VQGASVSRSNSLIGIKGLSKTDGQNRQDELEEWLGLRAAAQDRDGLAAYAILELEGHLQC
jgi:hypothetical protein